MQFGLEYGIGRETSPKQVFPQVVPAVYAMDFVIATPWNMKVPPHTHYKSITCYSLPLSLSPFCSFSFINKCKEIIDGVGNYEMMTRVVPMQH